MSKKSLMIVESPAKARTIGKLFGGDTTVMASMGHVSDLPQRSLGVDLANNFKPQYVITANGRKVIPSLKKAAAQADDIYLATDPDREGEAIAWHLQNLLKGSTKGKFHRIAYHEITRSAIANAFKNPGVVEMPLVDAQQARRVLDRIVGYQVSPMLWRSVEKDTSAGRVQSVALRLIVEREREIKAFTPVEYWTMEALFSPQNASDIHLKTRLTKINGDKANLPDAATSQALADALEDGGVSHKVSSITSTPRQQHPLPPFITSTLQQAAGGAFNFGTSQTMSIAQQLYEGIDLGGTTSGLITYMRTDSVNIASEAQQSALEFIGRTYGQEYVPATPNRYRSGKSAQEAHEAIRPTNVERTPESVAQYLTAPQQKLYRLIWKRFVASQMANARQIDHAIEIESQGGALATLVPPPPREDEKAKAKPRRAGEPPRGCVCTFRAAARETVFPGYLKVYAMRDLGQEDEMDNLTGSLPKLSKGASCSLLELKKEQCFTQPPSRYSEASLVKALESNGVGRPSTFASIVKTILDRSYVSKEKSSLVPTELGFRVNDFLVERFPDLFNVGFTAEMEKGLDEVEEGKVDWVQMLRDFYGKFQKWVAGGGARPAPISLNMKNLSELLESFPEDFEYDPPIPGARRAFNDKSFVKSLRRRIEMKESPTERQMAAFLGMIGRYSTRNPGLKAKIEKLGLASEVEGQLAANAAAEEARRQAAPARSSVEPALQELIDEMKKLEFEPPAVRGRRSFDDGKFFRSIVRQAAVTKGLSDSQREALRKLALKYARKLPTLSELFAKIGWNTEMPSQETDAPENAAHDTPAPDAAEENALCERLFALAAQIKTWNPPSSRGKRTFDDEKFVASLKTQYGNRGVLTQKQVDALAGVLGRYAEQLPEGALDGIEAAKSTKGGRSSAEETSEVCPNCGKPLKRIRFRGRTFLGCTGYPECKYTRNS